MPDITMHLTANFYPPIPHDIQIACQEFFDQIVEDAMPFQVVDKHGNIIDQDLGDRDVLDRTMTLPNGAEITAAGMLDELRLWEALFWGVEAETLENEHELDYSEYVGQLPFWENE